MIDLVKLLTDCDSAISWCRHRHRIHDQEEARDLDDAIVRIRQVLAEPHRVEFSNGGWAVLHTVGCRPNLQDCVYHQAVAEQARFLGKPPVSPGVYVVVLGLDGPQYTRSEE